MRRPLLTTVDGGGYGQAEAIGVRTTELSGSFTNSGTINATATLATADGGEGFAVGVELTGSSYHGMGDTLRNAGTLTNTGMISATANGNGGAAYGVAAPDGFSGTLNNSDRITASAAPSGTAYSLYIGDGGEGGKGAVSRPV